MINPCENVNGHRNETTCAYALTNIYPMENHPFKVKDDEDMAALVESIRQYGVLNPIIVRKRPTAAVMRLYPVTDDMRLVRGLLSLISP